MLTHEEKGVRMLQIMLCGAHDADELSPAFNKVAQEFGADPWFYQQGKIHHINSRTSRWTENSRATVKKVDICVFVIIRSYGAITWTHELQEALELGKPFVVLALESAWRRYTTLLHGLSDHTAISSTDDQQMVEVLRMISSDYQITVTPFTHDTFAEKLRIELSGLFEEGTHLVQERNRRAALLEALGGTGQLTREQTIQLIALATDEYEADKLKRKTALRRLADGEVRDEDLLIDVCRSPEQGVQRLGFDLLPQLIPLPVSEDLVRELAHIAGRCEDVGIPRRLVSSVAGIHPTMLDLVLEATGVNEEGVRRRAFEGLEEHWDEVLQDWGDDRLKHFLQICEAKVQGQARWIDRLRALREDLG